MSISYDEDKKVWEKKVIKEKSFVVAHLPTLLRKDRDACDAEVFADGPVGHTVGRRDGGFVFLEAYIVIVEVLVYVHYRSSGTDRCVE